MRICSDARVFINQLLHAHQSMLAIVCVNCRQPARMAGIPHLQQRQRGAIAHFSNNDPVWTQAHRCSEQRGDIASSVARIGAQRDGILRRALNLARVFDQDDAMLRRELADRMQNGVDQRGFARTRSANHQNIFALLNWMIRFAVTRSCGLIERYCVSSQPLAVYRNGLDVSAPTEHRSIILPDSSESTVCPTKAVISACSPRPSIPSSITPAISLPKRTQRVQWMQRVISSIAISGPAFLWKTTRLASV